MTTTIQNPTVIRTPLLLGGGLTALWLILGFLSNGTTYHLAPMLVAALPASLYALETDNLTFSRFGGLIAAGGTLAVASIGILAVAGNLAGPSLLPFGGAVIESLVSAGLGTVLALAVAFYRYGGSNDK